METFKEEEELFTLEVEGWKGDLYALEKDKSIWESPPELDRSYVRFLAPLDPMLWNRELFAAVFENEYVWEVYKPKEDRKYGHYCLPILFDEEYVGLIEPYLDGRMLEIRNLHTFQDVDEGRFISGLEEELDRYMEFLHADDISVEADHEILEDIR